MKLSRLSFISRNLYEDPMEVYIGKQQTKWAEVTRNTDVD